MERLNRHARIMTGITFLQTYNTDLNERSRSFSYTCGIGGRSNEHAGEL
jgi:hypothetical protein